MAINKTPVSLLQELAVFYKMNLPLYSDVESDNPLYPFKCIVKVGSVTACGYAHTKKEAKHNSAHKALDELTGKCEIERTVENKNNYAINYIGFLNEYASGRQIAYPQYTECKPKNLLFVIECNFVNLKTIGEASKKKQAKQEAAKLMVERIKIEDISYAVHSRKLDNVVDDDLVEKVLEKYKSLQISNQTIERSTTTHTSLPKIENNVDNMEDLLIELQKLGHTYSIEIFQETPYIIMLKIDQGSCIVMGHGKTEVLARNHLFEKATKMFRYGFSFNSILKM